MIYETFQVKDKEYKLRLRARDIVDLERRLGNRSPLDVFMGMQNNSVPKLGDLILFLHASMQAFHHNIKMENVYDIYDEYVEDGGSYMSLMMVIMDVFKVSGFFTEEQLEAAEVKEGEPNEKN